MLIIDKIRKYFETSPWQYTFVWPADGKKYGGKYETVKSLARIINHPKTSLYLSIHELAKDGFITFDHGLISYEREIAKK